jgi:microcystin-dependent protein
VLADGTHYNSVADPSFVNLYNRIGIDYGGTGPNDFAVPDRRGRVSVMVGTHADVNAVTDNEGLAVGSRTPKHRHTVTDPGHDHSISTGVGPDSGIGGGGGNRPGSFDPIVANTTGISVGPAGSPLDGPAYQPVYVYIVK